ncbi:MAG: tyrosine-type recombinase/integrase [Pseudomonadota bacterium]
MLYGSGLRGIECVRLRVKDIDFGLNQILVRDAKGNKDRITVVLNKGGRAVRSPLDKKR